MVSATLHVKQRMFRIIGQYSIDRDEDIIRVWSSSEFNVEAPRQYALDLHEMSRKLPAALPRPGPTRRPRAMTRSTGSGGSASCRAASPC